MIRCFSGDVRLDGWTMIPSTTADNRQIVVKNRSTNFNYMGAHRPFAR